MGAVKEDEHDGAIAADDGQDSPVSRRVGRGHQGDCSKREARGNRDADGGRQEHVVHVAGVGRARRHNSRRRAVDCVAKGHEAAVQEVEHIVCRVGESPSARGGVGEVDRGRDYV